MIGTAINGIGCASFVEQGLGWLPPVDPSKAQYSTLLLHRTLDGSAPDLRYWTAYDYFMAGMEARAQRRRARWRNVRERALRMAQWLRTMLHPRASARGASRGIQHR